MTRPSIFSIGTGRHAYIMSIAYIGIGSNLGDKRKNCEEAIRRLEEEGITLCKRSSLRETEPWGVTDQPRFMNMVIEVRTALDPFALLRLLKTVETGMGRETGIRWGPRIIDLDILLFDDLVLKTDELEIPHPEMANREFVLRPLAELAPNRIHPRLGKSVTELLRRNQQSF